MIRAAFRDHPLVLPLIAVAVFLMLVQMVLTIAGWA